MKRDTKRRAMKNALKTNVRAVGNFDFIREKQSCPLETIIQFVEKEKSFLYQEKIEILLHDNAQCFA